MSMAHLRKVLEGKKEEYLAHLIELVSRDTHCVGHGIEGGLEKNGQEYMEKILRDMGADISVEPMKEAQISEGIRLFGEGNPGHNYEDGRCNLAATFKGKGGRSILFDGHIDTMPAGDRDGWSLDPWKPEIRDNLLYGLGSCDMKGGLMASVMAVKLLQDAGYDLPGDVKILSVADEEGGGNGTLAAMVNGHRADAAVVCEPSSVVIVRAHMGFVFFKVETRGISLQSGVKWRGVNAIEKAMLLIQALNEMEHQWLMEYRHPLLPSPTLNIGVIRGGTAGSTVPDHCEFSFCLHYLPGVMDRDQVVKAVYDTLQTRSMGDAWLAGNPPEISIYQEGRAFEMDEDHPFVDAVKESIHSASGREALVAGSAAGNDARLLKNIGEMPTVILGPGPLENCHIPDEWLPLDEYYECILIYANLILNWTGGNI